MWRKDYVKKILVSEKELIDINFERLWNHWHTSKITY